MAASVGHVDIVRLLIEAGANINHQVRCTECWVRRVLCVLSSTGYHMRRLLDFVPHRTELGEAVCLSNGSSAASLSMCVGAADSPCSSIDARSVTGKLCCLFCLHAIAEFSSFQFAACDNMRASCVNCTWFDDRDMYVRHLGRLSD